MHDRAIEAACDEWFDVSGTSSVKMRRAVAAFLRAWEPPYSYQYNERFFGPAINDLAKRTADELESDNA